MQPYFPAMTTTTSGNPHALRCGVDSAKMTICKAAAFNRQTFGTWTVLAAWRTAARVFARFLCVCACGSGRERIWRQTSSGMHRSLADMPVWETQSQQRTWDPAPCHGEELAHCMNRGLTSGAIGSGSASRCNGPPLAPGRASLSGRHPASGSCQAVAASIPVSELRKMWQHLCKSTEKICGRDCFEVARAR
jgi:hypothetical protein